jgi:predicted glycosyltransferase
LSTADDGVSGMSPGRVCFYVQHLLGIGHLRRALRIASELSARGLRVTLISGGLPIPGPAPADVAWVQLPALRAADAGFSGLVDSAGSQVDDAWLGVRRDQLLAHFQQLQPHLLVTETFPFGRRQMRFELLPLLRAAHAQTVSPTVVCSVRDVLQSGRKPGRVEEAADWAVRHYDHILVHGDPGLIRFEESFPAVERLRERLHYTGYICAPPPARGQVGIGEVIVSAGGGAVGGRLLEIALAARPLSRARDLPWRLLVGDNRQPGQSRYLRARAARGVTVEPARPDFPALLANARLSISQGGYNTVMDILQTRARAVVVPFAGHGETEQTFRAGRLAERGLITVLEEPRLTPESLAAAVDRAMSRPRPDAGGIDLDGARASAALIEHWVRAARRRRPAGRNGHG